MSVLALLAGGVIAANAASATTPAANSANARLHRGSEAKSFGQSLTDEQKAERESRQMERETKQTAVKTAMDNNDYQAWLTAVGSDSVMAQKINSTENFAKLVQAHNLRMQADDIMTGLGFEGKPGLRQGRGFMNR